jgi:hypothetical protein
MTEHRLKPPAVHILFNPGADSFTRGKIKRSLDCAERLDRPVLIAAPIRHFRIINPNSRHDLLPVAKFDPAASHPRATAPTHPRIVKNWAANQSASCAGAAQPQSSACAEPSARIPIDILGGPDADDRQLGAIRRDLR